MQRDTKGLAEHLAYEIGMLWGTHNLLVTGKVDPQKDRQLHDAVLESFALHLRNLIEFFFDTRKRQRDRRGLLHRRLALARARRRKDAGLRWGADYGA